MSAEQPPEKVGTTFSSGDAITNTSSWKFTLPCTRAEAEAIDAADDIAIEAVLMTTEEVEDNVERWRLDAYFDVEPGPATIAAIRALVPSAARVEPVVEVLPDEDWVTLSQAGLEPIREGRFVVHTSAHMIEIDHAAAQRAFLINAGRAFGTGHHATTSGCLAMLDQLAVEGKRFDKIIDLGTGTGLLAFAAVECWPMADVTATDIDPVAIEVTRENAVANDVEIGIDIGEVALIVADGTRDPKITEWSSYDLIIANILAGPLIAMAPEIAAIAAPRATIVLAGLLTTQAEAVIAAYTACGCTVGLRDARGDWSILQLTAPAVPIETRSTVGDREAWATDGR